MTPHLHESETVEFKRELTENLEKEVIAFLNSEKGGDIYIGIKDDGSVCGVKSPDALQRAIIDRNAMVHNDYTSEDLCLW